MDERAPVVEDTKEPEVAHSQPEPCDNPLVTVITAVYNVEACLDETLASVLAQTYRPIEIACFDDGSTDDSLQILQKWKATFDETPGMSMYILRSEKSHGSPSYPRNRLIEAAKGEYLCILDADDAMTPERVRMQLSLARLNKDALIGCNFYRYPEDSTPYYVRWINDMDGEDLYTHRYRECTIICPTWFMHRSVFDRVGGFVEEMTNGQPPPEDLIFFHEHIDKGGRLLKVPQPLVLYRYRPSSMSSLMTKHTLQRVRLAYLAKQVLAKWPGFTIWGYGKDGKWFLNNLPEEIERQVTGFCDVDPNKVGMIYFCQRTRRHIPVIHYQQAVAPLIICVGSKRYEGQLEENVRSLGLVEGRDYFHFA